MSTRLHDVLNGREANYILPFLWQRGESEQVIREELARVHESGIRAVCVEARPHPDYLGSRWWRDMDIIMEEARRRDMRVWILDDDHFPSGHAAGKNSNASAALHRMFLKQRFVDTLGPQRNASIPLRPWFIGPPPSEALPDSLVAIIAARRDPKNAELTDELIDITANVRNDVLYWDVPEGYWRIFIVFSSFFGGSTGQRDYVNPIVAESVRVLIDSVYEAFYRRYRDDFGHALAGFFSDEPGFYNDGHMYNFQNKPGKRSNDLPWRPDMREMLNVRLGADCTRYLPLLWNDGGTLTGAVRCAYMDVVSRLYAEHFTTQIGEWCRGHGVEYIGHVLEDMGVHTRLGPGPGHYFRALWGQDMAGLDVVLWQLAPGFDQGPVLGAAGELDGEFYHYGLGKLGSSLAHIDPKKKNRALCEVFGAYGWREGLTMMKWMTDHMLVRGINHFVPHAFSQADFPDTDCPPHMYARGKNPQFRYYGELNRYTNRICHLLSGGTHIAPVAVLYHAEAEWSALSDSDWMPFHKPVAELLRNQIDCDVIPADVLLDPAASAVSGGNLRIADESYRCLAVPYSRSLPNGLLLRLAELAENGCTLLFVNGYPEYATEGADSTSLMKRLRARTAVPAVPLAAFAQKVRQMGFFEVEAWDPQPYLRYYHVRYPDLDVFMFANEHPFHEVHTNVRMPVREPVVLYDAFKNRVLAVDLEKNGDTTCLPIHLSAYESIIVLAGKAMTGIVAAPPMTSGNAIKAIEGRWSLSHATSEQYPSFSPVRELKELADMSRPDLLPTFSGTFRYETEFVWSESGTAAMLDLGEAYETAQVWINGKNAGVRICPPYRFAIGEFLASGNNRLVVEVTNTLVKQQRDSLSRYAPQEPSGLQGPVRLMH